MNHFLIENKEQLISYFQKGEKDPNSLFIGMEHENFLMFKATKKRVPYEGGQDEEVQGITSILHALVEQGWLPIFEKENIIALQHPHTISTISLEPGGQFELSNSPVRTLHEGCAELTAYFKQLDPILKERGIDRCGAGFDPFNKREDIPWMPKERYKIMRNFMIQKGTHGLDMMTRTCTVQASLDYTSEQDMVQKFRVSMALQPILSAVFAHSSVIEGKESGYNSYRNYVWQHTDADRCGLLPFVFQTDMGYERYVDYLLDVPMYYVYRHGRMNMSGQPFRTFLEKNLDAFPGQAPSIQDWIHQIGMVFPEVRLKQYLELRAADCGDDHMIMALPALWVGLLYDAENLKSCYEYVQTLQFSEIQEIYQSVPRYGLSTLLRQQPIGYLARFLVEKSVAGLRRRHNLNEHGQDESIYLEPLFDILDHQGYKESCAHKNRIGV